MSVPAQRPIERDIWLDERERQIIARHRLENSLRIRRLQIQIARRVAPQVNSCQHRKPRRDLLRVKRPSSRHCSHLTLLDQSSDHLKRWFCGVHRREIRPQRQRVLAKKSGHRQLLLVVYSPGIARNKNRGVRPIELSVIHRIIRHEGVRRNQPRNKRSSVVANAKQRQLVPPEFELPQCVHLVLLPVFQPRQVTIPVSHLHCDESVRRRILRTPTRHKIDIPIVARQLNERIQPFPRHIRRRQIHRIISFAHIKRAAVNRHRFNHRRNKKIRIGVTIPVRVRRQIVGIQKIPNLIKLRDRLPVIARHSRRKILRRLDSAPRRFNRITRNRNGRARPAWIRIEHLIVHHKSLRGIGRQ